MEYQTIARRVIIEQAEALQSLSTNLPADFSSATTKVVNCRGRVILTGMGKSGYIARKLAASFASTGTAAFYIHPAEASHGDLGMISEGDIVIMLSNSGETKELFDIINYCKRFGVRIIGMTMKPESTLGRSSDLLLTIPKNSEASSISAPTTSALMMLSLGDALTVAVQEIKGFSADDFRIFHPGGKLGASLLRVSELMRVGDELPIVSLETSFNETIALMTKKALGCAIVVEGDLCLKGIITDGDLRRHIKNISDLKCAKDFMTMNPKSISPASLASEAIHLMNSKGITCLPVVENQKLVGLLHIHNLLKAGIG